MSRIKLTNKKYLEDEGDGEDDGDYEDEQLLVEGREDDERVDGEGAPPSEDSVAREFGELGKKDSETVTGQYKVVHQAKLPPGEDGEARDPGRGHSNVALNQDIPNLNKQENVNKYEKPAKTYLNSVLRLRKGNPAWNDLTGPHEPHPAGVTHLQPRHHCRLQTGCLDLWHCIINLLKDERIQD